MSDAPHTPAAFINVIAEEGSKKEAVEWLQKTWNERCHLERENEALRKDAERLDFLESEAQVNFSYEICSIEFEHNAQEEGYNTIREVIDAAIKEQSNE
jgi:hypothetical protein